MKRIFKTALMALCVCVLAAQIFVLLNATKSGDSVTGAALEASEAPTTELIQTTEPETTEEPTTEIPELLEIAEPVSKDMPVLMYHTSSEHNPGGLAELYVKPSEFEKQVKYLAENGFTFCTFDDYYYLGNIEKPVFITFDDGYRENYTEIFPILQKYDAKITLFLAVNFISDSELTRDMILEMNDSGLVKFESHTMRHPDLTTFGLNSAGLASELENSKIQIEELTKKPVLALAYPAGKFNDEVKKITEEFYSFGLSVIHGMHNTDFDRYEIRRFRINRSTKLETFIKYFG